MGTVDSTSKWNKIDYYNAQGFIIKNFDKSAREISRLLKEKGIDISHNSIYVWKRKTLKDLGFVITKDKEYLKRLAEQKLDTLDNLVELQDKIKTYIEDIEEKLNSGYFDEDEIKAYNMLNSLLNTWAGRIALFMKKQGELVQRFESIEKKEVTLNINQSIQNQILEWMEKRQFVSDEKKGLITIYAPEIIDLFKKKKKVEVNED